MSQVKNVSQKEQASADECRWKMVFIFPPVMLFLLWVFTT
jgi:hypothetical protein